MNNNQLKAFYKSKVKEYFIAFPEETKKYKRECDLTYLAFNKLEKGKALTAGEESLLLHNGSDWVFLSHIWIYVNKFTNQFDMSILQSAFNEAFFEV